MIRTRWALVTLLATCLLGACSDDDPKPNIADPTASASSSSATVSPSPTTASPQTLTPRETVDAWLAAWTTAMQTGETQSVHQLSGDGCDSCDRLIAKVEEVYLKGGRYETEGWSATRISEAPDSIAATPSFVMQVVQADRSLFGADGQLVDEAQRIQVPMRMTFENTGERWVLSRLEILE